MPLSPNVSSQLTFDRRFWQSSIRLDKEFVEVLCSRLINRPLDVPLRFRLTPFSPELEVAWRQAVQMIRDCGSEELAFATQAWKHFEEFLGTLVLETHPHNFSDVLKKESSAADPRLVRNAEHLMQTGGPSITVSEVAKELRISLRSLELGFRDARNMTPTQAHRQIRLSAAREALLNPTSSTSVLGHCCCVNQPSSPANANMLSIAVAVCGVMSQLGPVRLCRSHDKLERSSFAAQAMQSMESSCRSSRRLQDHSAKAAN